MNDIAIRVENLSKQYRIGSRQGRYKTLRDTLTDAFVAPIRRAGKLLRGQATGAAELDETIWALKDVSFQVKRGEVIGIIGRNGAGKTTLLKILSQITEPTEGRARIRGRVGSLLEVGTGFHPELTGRENIYLNGAILGMGRAEIDRKFDEIVAFAEVEKFIDTPVKHFSTGMYLRLAFSVAAHLEPEILLIDEVLAVGDAAFQKKCTAKMEDVAQLGRTVLFVSHNLAAVRALCEKGILLEKGSLVFWGDISTAIHKYGSVSAKEISPNKTGRRVEFTSVCINNNQQGSIISGEAFDASCTLHLQSALSGFRLFCIIQDIDGGLVVAARTNHHELQGVNQCGSHHIRISFPALWLKPGVYSLHFKLLANTLGRGKMRYVSDNIMLDVSASRATGNWLGYLAPEVSWSVEIEETLFTTETK